MQNYTIDIRPRRQTTIPKSLLEKVGIGVGDKLVATTKDDQIILKAQKNVALDAYKELQRIVKTSGTSEKELQQNARKMRKELYVKRTS